ncbi:MAG: hypothetical protein WC740_07160 [Verrucomicrobiia bacterium]
MHRDEFKAASRKAEWQWFGVLIAFVVPFLFIGVELFLPVLKKTDDGPFETTVGALLVMLWGAIILGIWVFSSSRLAWRHGLNCPGCRKPLFGVSKRVLKTGKCPFCQTQVLDDAPPTFEPETPWLLSHCPPRFLPLLEKAVFAVGLVSEVTIRVGGACAILFAPLLFAALRPDAPISQPVMWLRAHTNKDQFLVVYLLIQVFILLMLTWASSSLDYLRIRDLLKEHAAAGTRDKNAQDATANRS